MSVHASAETAAQDWLRRATRPAAIAWVGIVVALVGLWLALPPWLVTWQGVPIALGVAGIAAGMWAYTRDERRLGWWAVAAGVLGAGVGVWAQGLSQNAVEGVVNVGLVTATLRAATPLVFAAMGGILSERSGVVNIGLEGMMLTGAFFGIWGADKTGSWGVGLLIAMGAGGALALVHAYFSIHLRADQVVSGTAINFLALGVTGYLFRDLYSNRGTPSDVPRVPDADLSAIHSIPFVGPVFDDLNLMVWLSFLLLIVTSIAVFRTPYGLRLRAVGEHPRAADTVGISVYKTRYTAVILSGVLAALGGAYLSVGFVGSFSENMTAGRGFIALAAVIFGKWRPFGAFGACLLFGFASGMAQRLQSEADISANLLSTLPYVLTLVALVGLIGRSRGPAASGRPYIKQ